MMKLGLLSLLVAFSIAEGAQPRPTKDANWASPIDPGGADWCGDTASEAIRLNQGWSVAQSDWFYWTSQGSQLIPYAFFTALESSDGSGLFREPRNMQRYRFLPAPLSSANPDGLPIGLVTDPDSSLPPGLLRDHRSFGFTCAACHTTQINYKGTAIRIDGAPALADVAAFLSALTEALQSTDTDKEKFQHFSDKLLGAGATNATRKRLHAALHEVATKQVAYGHLNYSDVAEGFGRLDAFGRIFNRALTLVDPTNRIKADAPVRFPNIWNATRQDYVQWTGVSPNNALGPLLRNVGELVGVFAAIDPGNPPPNRGYDSSIRFKNVRALETRLKSLKSPAWPENVLPPIDRQLAAAGRTVFAQQCEHCHRDVGRDYPRHRLVTVMIPLGEIGTDPRAAEHIVNARGRTGFLEGMRQRIYAGKPIEHTATAFQITEDTVLHMVLGKLAPHSLNKPMHKVNAGNTSEESGPEKEALVEHSKHEPRLQYKAPPLNGVWAAAPYLHNGSVPTLYEVLLPPEKRSPEFAVGRREFDPVKVGFLTEPVEGTFQFDTTIAGNKNTGHPFGAPLSEAERWQVVEYLKTL